MEKGLFRVLLLLSFIVPVANAIETTTVDEQNYSQNKIKIEQVIKKQWNLNQVELDRYQELMKGIRGSLSVKNISPLEVLGIHARDDRERKKYALAWAKVMREDTERVLKFQFAYDDATKRLVGNQQMINMVKVNEARRKKNHVDIPGQIKEKDRVLLFVRYEDCSKCENLLSSIKQQMASLKRAQLDIYFFDTVKGKDDKKLREWSLRNGLNRAKLVNGSITLNHDKKLVNRHFGITAELPIAAVIRNSRLQRIK